MKKIFLLVFILSTRQLTNPATIFCQEPIILPPVTITGEDKSEEMFERFQKQPRIIMGESPKISSKRREPGGSFFSLYFSAGGYDYLNWKIKGGKELAGGISGQVMTYLALIDKLRIGPYGSTGRLNEYNVDNFHLDFSFPFFGNTNLFSSLKYQERNESLTHPSIGGTSNIMNHRAKDAELNLGLRGKIGGLVHLTLCPYYNYVAVLDERINVDTQVVSNQERIAGLKLNAQAEMKNLSLVGDVQVEANQRPELDKSGANLTVYFGGRFGFTRIPRLNLNIGFQYISPYLFSTHFNPELGASYRFENGLLLRTIFKGETMLPTYKLFANNYVRFNPLLREEQDWSFSLEAEKEFGKADASFKFFHQTQENLISFGSRNTLWQPVNIPGFATKFGVGLSTRIRYSIWKGNVYGRIGYTFQQAIPGEGKSIPYFPGNELLTGIGYEIGNFKIEISGNYSSSCYADTQATTVIPGSFLTSFNVSLGIAEQIFIFFNGDNLSDAKDYILDNYPVVGRNFKGGIEIKF